MGMGIEGIGFSRNIESVGWPTGFRSREELREAEREAAERLREKLERDEALYNSSKKKGE